MTFSPLTDEHGRQAYSQSVAVQGPVAFLPEDMDYGNLFPNTTFPDGQPLLRRWWRSSVHHAGPGATPAPVGGRGTKSLLDRCPHGDGNVAFKRFEAQMEAKAGRDDKLKMVALRSPTVEPSGSPPTGP